MTSYPVIINDISLVSSKVKVTTKVKVTEAFCARYSCYSLNCWYCQAEQTLYMNMWSKINIIHKNGHFVRYGYENAISDLGHYKI